MGRFIMIERFFHIKKYDWNVTIYYNATCDDAEEILNILNFFEINKSLKKEVGGILYRCLPNVGFTYTNTFLKETVIVIGQASSFDEFLNTLTHENMHSVMHITESYNISPYSEEPCYLLGELIQHEAGIIKKIVCNN